MAFLVQQSEVNDCGVAICVMVLNQFQKKIGLDEFKVKYAYNHEQYSFATMQQVLEANDIMSQSYEYQSFDELQEFKNLICLQVINSQGQYHFVLVKYVNHSRWIVYDPQKNKPYLVSQTKLEQISTGFVQVYESQLVKVGKKINLQWSNSFYKLFQANFWGMLFVNTLLFLNFFLIIIVNSFLRIVFQDFQFLTILRAGILSLGLLGVVVLNWIVDYLIKLVFQVFATRFYQKILHQSQFQSKFNLGVKYLKVLDFEKSYFQFQNNITNLLTLFNYLPGTLGFLFFLITYFYQVNTILTISSLMLIMLILLTKFFKLKGQKNLVQKTHFKTQNYFYEFRLLIKNWKSIQLKTSLATYVKLKGIDHFYHQSVDDNKFQFLERFLIYFYYLGLCLLLDWQSQNISVLIIFTSMTITITNSLERLLTSCLSFDLKNYFNACLKLESKQSVLKERLWKLTYQNQVYKQNYLVIVKTNLEKVFLNNLPLNNYSDQTYFANESLNFDETVYNNIFNYNLIDAQLFQEANILEFIQKYELNLEGKLVNQNLEIIKYLSCYFAFQKIVILNLPNKKSDQQALVKLFPEKVFIFLKDES